MNRCVTRFAAIAGLVLMTGTAWAQTSSYPAPGEIAGKVRDVFPAQQAILLEDGTLLQATSAAQLDGVEPGSAVKVLYVDNGDKKEIQGIEPIAQ
jgi:hypothetical protein